MANLFEALFMGKMDEYQKENAEANRKWEESHYSPGRPSLGEAIFGGKMDEWQAGTTENKQKVAAESSTRAKQMQQDLAKNEKTTEAQRNYNRSAQNLSLLETVNSTTNMYTPTIRVNDKGTGLILSGTKDALQSDMAKELRTYLTDALQYQNLQSENVAKIIEELNADIHSQIERSVVENGVGMNYDKYKDYAHAMEVMSATNPMTRTGDKNKIAGYDKNGKLVYKTPQEWIEYYRENYNSTERVNLFTNAGNIMNQSGGNATIDPALWTPYLVMSGGGSDSPVYGFDTGERILAGLKSLVNEGSARLIEGGAQNALRGTSAVLNTQGFLRRDNLKARAKNVLGTGDDITSADIPWISEEEYNAKIDSIKDKSVRALSKDEKNFFAAALGDYSNQSLDDAVRNSETVGDVLNYASYNKYINSRDNLATTEQYDAEINERSSQLASGRQWLQNDIDAAAVYAPIDTTIGAFAGTMMRMWAENAIIKTATGGLLAPAEISDALAGKFMKLLNPTGSVARALQTPVGSFLLSVTAELPEDVVQTIIDDVMIGRAGDIPLLAPTGDLKTDMEKLGKSFAQNLAFRLAFTPFSVGAQKIREWRAIKAAAKAAGMDATVSDQLFVNNAKLKDAADAGTIVDLTENSATIKNPDGTESVLDNVAMLHFGTDAELADRYPGIAEMLRKKGLISDVADTDLESRIDMAKNAVENGDYDAGSGVSKVTIAPYSDPFKGYEVPESVIHQRSLTDTYVPYINDRDSVRMELPAPKGLDEYDHNYNRHLHSDYSDIFKKSYGDVKELGALNILFMQPDAQDIIHDSAFMKALKEGYKDSDLALVDASLEGEAAALELSYFPKGTAEAEAKAEIETRLNQLIEHYNKVLIDLDARSNEARSAHFTNLAKEIEEATISLTNTLSQITDEYGNLKSGIVDKLYDFATKDDSDFAKAISMINDSRTAIGDSNSALVLKGIQQNGVKLQQGIVVEGKLSNDGKVLFFSLDSDPESYLAGPSDNAIYHIPKGSKIASIEGYPGEYVVDVSKGMTEQGGDKYINKPDGSAYKPRSEAFDFDRYAIDEQGEVGVKGYMNFGKEYLDPVGEKSPEADRFYYAVGPGGTVKGPEGTERIRYNVNIMNQRLRSESQLGTMTPAKPGDVLDAILASTLTGNTNAFIAPDTENVDIDFNSALNALERWTKPFTNVGSALEDANFNTIVSDDVMKWAQDTDSGKSFVNDLKSLQDWVEQQYRDGSGSNMSDDMKKEFLNKILDIQIKYNNGSFTQLPRTFQAIMDYKERAPYKAKKDFIIYRGVNDFGRGGLRASGELPFGSLRVGDDWNDAGFAYTSLSPYVARGYAGYNDGIDGRMGAYIIRYSVPEGTPVIYFGDPSHFGNRLHFGDGGAIVLPRGVRGKVSAITDTAMGRIIDVALASPDGNIPGLKKPLDVFNENFPSSYRRKGLKMAEDIDGVFGKGTGDMVVGEVANALEKSDADVTAANVRKFLNSEEGSELAYQLNSRLYQADTVTVFRGQSELGKLAHTADNIDAGEDGYHFTRSPEDAYNYGGSVIRMDFDRKYIASPGEIELNLTHLSAMPETPDPDTDAETAALIKTFNDGQENKAIAMATKKPILESYNSDGTTTYTYIPGIDEDFDKAMEAQILASTEATPLEAQADRANVEMANDVLRAIETEPYDRTINEIVADKYKQGAATIDEAPSSASYKWESPDVTKTYDSPEAVFADMPVGKNMTETRQWVANARGYFMNRFTEEVVPKFQEAYPTVEEQQQFVRNMDYLFDLQRKGGETLDVSNMGKTLDSDIDRIAYIDKQMDEIKTLWDKADALQEEMNTRFHEEYPNGAKEYPSWYKDAQKTRDSYIDRAESIAVELGYHEPGAFRTSKNNVWVQKAEAEKKEIRARIKANNYSKIGGSVIGKTYESEGVTYTVNEKDVRFYVENIEPIMKDLREAGAAGQGKEAFTIIGYFPHSDYDPELLTAEDSLQQGVLWREYTGASTTSEDGNFSTGWLNPDMDVRYRTFVNNMLWDSLGDNVVVAKYMEEFNADGLDVKANDVEAMVGGRKRLAHMVSQSDSAKDVVKHLVKGGEMPTNDAIEASAKKLGATDVVHNMYKNIYGSSEGLNQRGNVSLMSKSDWMRSLSTGDGTLYDNGGAMLVNGNADAKYLAKQIFEAVEKGEEIDVKQMFVEYLTQNHRRTTKGATYIAGKWMDKIAQKAENGGISRRALTAELGRLIYGEGANRVFRFIGRMDASKLNGSNRAALDSLLFRHSVLSKVINTSGFSARLNKAANALIGARMKSLFWLNFKNAVLQASECIRLLTEFRSGDALDTIKKLATDAEFRAEVDEWVDMFVPERFVKSDNQAPIEAMATIAENSSYKNGELTVNKLSAADMKRVASAFDKFASSPVEMGEALKNRVIMAGILQEAKRKGFTGNELFSYVSKRFERIGIAANEMGRLNASDSPLFRIGANLKTFQIRQLSMFINNINDMNGKGEVVTYILKNLGWKLGLAVILAKLGYSAASTLGFDPFDLMDDDYNGVDEEDYKGLDYVMMSPAAKLFLSGGFTGYINDLYWASRKAYEDNSSVAEQAGERADDSFWPGFAAPESSFDDMLNAFGGFIPGYTAGKRVVQMNELMDAGWAVSAKGNKQYAAPTNPVDIATGYLFGRSNTPQARAYYQTPDYLQGLLDNGLGGLGQQIGREIVGGFRRFDPIDKQNYTGWFNGDAGDEQQWNSGYYYFLDQAKNIQDEYQNALRNSYNGEVSSEVYNAYNAKLRELDDSITRFVRAYQAKNPNGFNANKMNNILNVMRVYQPNLSADEAERKQQFFNADNAALQRYVAAGLPQQVSYRFNPDKNKTEVEYSPQVRAAMEGRYGLPQEAAKIIKKIYNEKWKELNKQYRDKYYSTKNSKEKKAIQAEYFNLVRKDLDPIVALYGAEIFSNDDVDDVMEDVFNSMMPYGMTAKKYLQEKYKNYMSGSVSYSQPGNETITEIKELLNQGKAARGKALARTLLQRVQENRQALTRDELEWLQGLLNE